jgi:rare lipoprotein A (peptidoglycan hydrolase)
MVRVVDRFAKVSKRIVDVSEAAARQLDFIKAGTAEVRLQSLRYRAVSPDRQGTHRRCAARFTESSLPKDAG